jgi:hypothetical protein
MRAASGEPGAAKPTRGVIGKPQQKIHEKPMEKPVDCFVRPLALTPLARYPMTAPRRLEPHDTVPLNNQPNAENSVENSVLRRHSLGTGACRPLTLSSQPTS